MNNKHEYKVNVKLGDYSLDKKCFNNLVDVEQYIENYTTENVNENLFGMVSYLDLDFVITDNKGRSVVIK